MFLFSIFPLLTFFIISTAYSHRFNSNYITKNRFNFYNNQNGCKINTKNDMTATHPLIVKYDHKNKKVGIMYPKYYNTVQLNKHEQMILACPGTTFRQKTSVDLQKVQCLGNDSYGSGNDQHIFSDYVCQKVPQSKLILAGKCVGVGNNVLHYQIGFQIHNIGQLNMIDVCFDKGSVTSLFAKHEITPNVLAGRKDYPRVLFKESINIYDNISPNTAYSKKNQIRMMYRSLPRKIANKYINNGHYLSRGHFAPKADFVYASQQEATFYYINTAPQWQSFNSGNWLILENSVRRLAVVRKINLTVYTGVHGTLLINGQPLYLTKGKYNKPAMPVPALFWKIIIDEEHGEAITFVGFNDPHANPINNPAIHFCSPGLCKRLKWIQFDKTLAAGVMNCCTLVDFKNNIKMPLKDYNRILY